MWPTTWFLSIALVTKTVRYLLLSRLRGRSVMEKVNLHCRWLVQWLLLFTMKQSVFKIFATLLSQTLLGIS